MSFIIRKTIEYEISFDELGRSHLITAVYLYLENVDSDCKSMKQLLKDLQEK